VGCVVFEDVVETAVPSCDSNGILDTPRPAALLIMRRRAVQAAVPPGWALP